MKRLAALLVGAIVLSIPGAALRAQVRPPRIFGSYVSATGGGSSAGLTDTQLRASPVPVSVSSATVSGGKTNNNAAPAADNLSSLDALANAADPTWTEGRLVLHSVDLTGYLRALVKGTVAVSGTVTVAGTVTANQGGTWTVQPGNTANTTAWKVDGSAVTQPVSGTVTANAAQSGTWTVQPGNTANTTAWKVDGSAVTQPVSLAANQSVNVAQINGVTPLMGNGVSGTGAQRVTIASDSTGNLGVAQASTTAGQIGPLVQGAVSRFYPADTLLTTAPLTLNAGGMLRTGIYSEVDAGNVLGTPWMLSPEVSEDFRTRVELDNFLDNEVINYTAQNTGKFKIDNTTMTFTHSGGFVTNNGAITTINTGVALSTYQYFPIFGSQSNLAYMKVTFQGTMLATNTTIDWGFGVRPTSTPYVPTDGAFFRSDSTGIKGCIANNTTTTCTAAFVTVFGGAAFTPTIGTEYDTLVTVQPNVTVFWWDQKDGNGYSMMGRITNPTTQGNPTQAMAAPLTVRQAIGGTVASASRGITLISYTINQGGTATNRPWAESASAAGLTGAQGIAGQTQGSTALYTNSLATGAGAVMTNTTAALGTGLGGQFTTQPTLAIGTDGIVDSYQNPAPTVNITGRTLVIDSISISSVIATALTTASPVYAYSLAWGHTSVSLATAEAQNAKAPRRKALCIQNYGAPATIAAGTMGTPLCGQFQLSDVVVQPGEFIAIVAKNIGPTLTTSTGTITFLINITSHNI
jgi:hypothetical protein